VLLVPSEDAVTRLSRRALLGAAASAAIAPRARADDIPRAPPRAAPPTPILCVSHGSPRLAFDPARYAPVRAWGEELAKRPKPRGILVMTPHFASERLLLGPHARGFAMYNLPPALKRQLPADLDYPSPPSDALASRVRALLPDAAQAEDRRGFDHTTWIPLSHLYPAAGVPVLEIGFPYVHDADLFALGKRLAPLRDEEIVFVASGGVTHNLASLGASEIPAWSKEFDAWTVEKLGTRAYDAIVDWRHKAPAAELAHPDDGGHFRVFLVALGIATSGGASPEARYPVASFEATMSVRSFELT
jgi:4,5-DOPA dioxygenase extradiol